MDHSPSARDAPPLPDLPPLDCLLDSIDDHDQRPHGSPLRGNNMVTETPESGIKEVRVEAGDNRTAGFAPGTPEEQVVNASAVSNKGEGESWVGDASADSTDPNAPDALNHNAPISHDTGTESIGTPSQDNTGLKSDLTHREDGASNDLLEKIPSMHRLLDLLYEVGSNGLVEKIVVDQKSLGSLLNKMLPGSFRSISTIDFKSLDTLNINPIGVYGSRPEVAKFLEAIGTIDETIAQLLARDEEGSSPGCSLGPGLYLVLPSDQGPQGDRSRRAYVVFWPERETWCDNASPAVEQNRVTFMRYLTQLTDQIIALVSEAEASLFNWDPTSQDSQKYGSTRAGSVFSRVRTYRVHKTENQQENVTAREGFKVNFPRAFTGKHIQLIGGETTSGLLVSSFEGPRTTWKHDSGSYTTMRLEKLFNHPVALGSRLDNDELLALADSGLRAKYPDLFAQYHRQIDEAGAKRDADITAEMELIKRNSVQQRSEIEQRLRDNFRKRSRDFRAYISSESAPGDSGKCQPLAPPPNKPGRSSRTKKPLSIDNLEFQELKMRVRLIRAALANVRISGNTEEQRAIVQKFTNEPLGNLMNKSFSFKAILSAGFEALASPIDTFRSFRDGAKRSNPVDESDLDFIRGLENLVGDYPVLFELAGEVIKSLTHYLSTQEDSIVNKRIDRMLADSQKSQAEKKKVELDSIHRSCMNALWMSLWTSVRSALKNGSSHPLLVIDSIKVHKQAWSLGETTFDVQTTLYKPIPGQTTFCFYPLQLTKDDIRQSQRSDTFVPRPIIPSVPQFEFKLEEGLKIEFIHTMHDKCLVIVSSQDRSYIFMNKNNDLERAMNNKNSKSALSHSRLGSRRMYAYDEATRILVVCHGPENLTVNWFTFDEDFSALRSSGVVPLSGWYDPSVQIERICMVTGNSDLCLLDSAGSGRILSLPSGQIGAARVEVRSSVRNAFSAPDGSCLFVVSEQANPPELRAFHWASFKPDMAGFCPTTIDPGLTAIITSFDRRDRMYLVTINSSKPDSVASVALQVQQKSAKYDFRSKQRPSEVLKKQTTNNCLIDCHSEVWSRFPVLPAVSRSTLPESTRKPRTITFVSDGNFSRVNEYFAELVSKFERSTLKPTGGRLFGISVGWSFRGLLATLGQVYSSSFNFGGFVVELLCLIPVQLAVTRENRFIPLKDGVLDPAFDKQLLGANVPTIINLLSLGGYESIFQSYMARKQVRVVSSMGEQSVGKSYCLNHFADTSFAGSAKRTTEGVWLSCTPTEDYLLVSLDFEGVQSVERSPQEDTLLVLFNAAISNMVLFRNNFAVSRSTTTLFKGFRSSATVLDPDKNPELFNSDLAVIIKDVPDSDIDGIVDEFDEKFNNMVEEDQENNFITKLHRGQLHILPWPVIKSKDFYILFGHIRELLEERPVTHGEGGVFLHMLKTLMAKIMAHDWVSLDQTRATHRAKQITDYLPYVLGYGGIEQLPKVWAPMKEIDTDQEIQHDKPVTDDAFWVPRSPDGFTQLSGARVEQFLASLILRHGARIGQRHELLDADYIYALQDSLYAVFDQRVDQTQRWITTNIQKFSTEYQEIRNLLETFKNMANTSRAALQICAAKCSTCFLSCLRPSQHKDDHDCGTNHLCVSLCAVTEQHSEPANCGLKSGHDGRHLCKPQRHTCGQSCLLEGRAWSGCETFCAKEIDHRGDHFCSATVHYCGKPCSLKDVKSIKQQPTKDKISYDCPGFCQLPWDQEHDQHACAITQCPIACQLCSNTCRHTDHFHGLEADSLHLCGQMHRCTMQCEVEGICQIETEPSEIIERFTGRFDSFQYTRFAQKAQKLSCNVPIEPGQVAHQGPHTHGTSINVIHTCETKCPRCNYYCTLPFGHSERLHDTRHGSMTETRWLLEATSQSYQIQGHKYGSGDQGSTMLCNVVCTQQGRHVHVDYCRHADKPQECGGQDHQHIHDRILPHPNEPKDWISHKLYWERANFRDPYLPDQKAEFEKCDAYCPDTAHPKPFYCNLRILHAPRQPDPTIKPGYISQDGHLFSECSDPLRGASYHVVFVIDSSSSMTWGGALPLSGTPITSRLRSSCNNRYGAVLSAVYGFLKSREPAVPSNQLRRGIAPSRTDAYSVIAFNSEATTLVDNDLGSTADQLIDRLIAHRPGGGTKFSAALEMAHSLVLNNWDRDRAPVVIFLSDGEDSVTDEPVLKLCQLRRMGKPIQFYTFLFGEEAHSGVLRNMAKVARDEYAKEGHADSNKRCSYLNTMDSIQLAVAFENIAKSLQKPRAALIGSRYNRLPTAM